MCTEVIHYNISTASIGSSAIAIFAQEVYWLFQSNGGGGAGRISMKLWMSHSEQILSPSALKCFYCCSHLGFLWTPQGTVIYRTIKYNLCSNPLQSPSSWTDKLSQRRQQFQKQPSILWAGLCRRVYRKLSSISVTSANAATWASGIKAFHAERVSEMWRLFPNKAFKPSDVSFGWKCLHDVFILFSARFSDPGSKKIGGLQVKIEQNQQCLSPSTAFLDINHDISCVWWKIKSLCSKFRSSVTAGPIQAADKTHQ